MEFVTPIITPIVESVMVPVKKHLGFLFYSKNYVRNMHARLLELNHTAHDLEKKREANNANNLVIPDHVPSWLEQVKTINEEAGDIPRDGNGCLDIKKRYTTGKRLFDILNKIDDLEKQESKIKWTNEQIPLGMVISSTSPSTTKRVHDDDGTQHIFRSRQLVFKHALKSLEPTSKTQKMALCGMGGVGKTTMMEEVKKVVEKRGMFKWVFKVVIGEKYDPTAIQQAIAQYIGKALTETTKDARADRLKESFKKISENGNENVLIILDDVWEEVDLKDIGLTSPLPKGFKLFVTSRDEKVCIKMDIETSSIFKMVPLEETESNFLFWETVRLTDGDGELHKIGEDILRKCDGLPMAIKTIALTLRGEEKDAWISALVRLQRRDLEDIYSIVSDIFEISYNNLKKDDDKEIFILCGLFPLDIAMEELMRYGWGLQLFRKAYSLKEARQRTNTSVSNLIRANLLIESNKKGCVKMHDLARDFVLSNISKFKQVSIVSHGDMLEWPTQDTRESCERILIKCKSVTEFPQDFYYPNLTLLKLMNGDKLLKFPEDFHKRMEKLQVIAYDEMQSPLDRVSLQCSISLRTLCLRSCLFLDNDISCLGDIINLEVLSIAQCGIKKLPSTIKKLKRLKLLDLTGCLDLCIEDGVFQHLDKLEELYMRVSEGKAFRFTRANCDELEMLSSKLYALEIEFFDNILEPKNVSFKKLQRFRISMGCLLKEETDYTTGRYSFKNTLKLVTNCNDLLECKINELFSQTEELDLSVKDMRYVEDILLNPSQYSTFCNLKVLHVFKCVDLTHLFTNRLANGLKKLESLTISSCPILKSLVSLCDNVNVVELPQLLDLKLYDLPNFTSIFPENNISPTQSFLNNEIVIPKLSKLTVGSMENLKQIWPCHITSGEEDNVSMLREIEVDDCNRLVNLFPRNPMRLLSHLEELRVERCCSIESLFNINLNEKLSSNTSSLRRIKVDKLDELREVWKINDENNFRHIVCGFQAIETIDIRSCKKFRNVVTPTTTNFDLQALMDIQILDCGENNVELVNNGQEAKSTCLSKLQEISKVDENMSIVSFSSYHLTHTFHHLRHIYFNGFKGVKVMFEIESPSNNGELVTSQHQPLHLLPCLEEIELQNMDTLSHVWKWKDFYIFHKNQPQSFSFENLTSINLSTCNGMKYLFSPLMFKHLSSLKEVRISYCESMEEVVSNRDDDNEVLSTSTSTTTLFPHLDFLCFVCLYNLSSLNGTTNVIHEQVKFSQVRVVTWSLCQYAREIRILECPALSSVIPYYAAGQVQELQDLTVDQCKSMVELFETKKISNNGCTSSNVDQGSDNILPIISRPKQTVMHEFPNLMILKISKCNLLEYIFTFSTLESLKKLESLSIVDCAALKVIVREENEEASSKVVVVFPRLKSIELDHLPNLGGFLLEMSIDFQLPSVDYVLINDCPQMMVFTSGQTATPKLKYIHTRLGKHNLACGLNFHRIPSPSSDTSSSCPEGIPWSFHNLIEMYLDDNTRLKTIVQSSELIKLQNLEKITLNDCQHVEEVFEEVTNAKSETVVKFTNLREVELNWANNLRYIWKSNSQFPNLTRVFIHLCNNLEHVFTSSMVSSLMQLQELHISSCKRTEEIVKKEEECDGKVSEVIFPCLKSLQLENLWSLKGFSLGKDNLILPSLNTLVIKECPKIRIFSEGCSIAPQLKVVETSFGVFHVGKDINSFIMTKNQEGIIFGGLEEPSSPPCLVM